MTPQEKAQEIWMKLFQKQIEVTGSGDGNLCVEMSLIAVDEQIELLLNLSQYMAFPDHVKHLQEIKQEIEKL